MGGPETGLELDGVNQNAGRLVIMAREIESHAELHINHWGQRLEPLCFPEFYQPPLKISRKRQVHAVPLVRNRVVRVERERSSELDLCAVPVSFEKSADDSQADMCL